jgi:hypothetical protein
MSEDLLRQSPKVLAQITITLVEGVGLNIQIPIWADELVMRGLLSKLEATMDDHYRAMNTPRVVAGNGMPPEIQKHLRG